MGYRGYSTAKGHIVDASGHGDFTTIQSAINAAVSGQTIFVRDGTYTENLTLKPGVGISSFGSAASLTGNSNVIIKGTCSLTATGSVDISSVQLETNGAAFLSITGTNASIINVDNCYLSVTDATGIINSSTSATSAINISDCNGNISSAVNALFLSNGNGIIFFYNSDFQNTGNSSAVSTIVSGNFFSRRSFFACFMSTNGTATASSFDCQWDVAALVVPCWVFQGSGIHNFIHSQFFAGANTAITVNNTSTITESIVDTSNVNAIDGTGTIKAGIITFTGASSTISTAVVTPLRTYGGTIF